MKILDNPDGARSTIFIVDDNDDILLNLRMLLEFSEFNVISARNGKEALDTLHGLKKLPDIIVSDIMMPEMNGYDLLRALGNEPRLSQIPFIFLSAKSTQDDVRLGKILGADDYLTKPFNQDDLIATIKGKIARKKRMAQFSSTFGAFNAGECAETTSPYKTNTYLFHVVWDDKIGPVTREFVPKTDKMPFNVQEIGYQLFNASSAIYGDKFAANAEGILLTLANIKQHGYIFFDSYPDKTSRAGVMLYMLAVIAPCISYLVSLHIKKVFEELTSAIKQKKQIDLEKYHQKILTAFS
ncbi:MAG: response regulator [Candidatus Lokiarchaeota archaeon]|nr:response regulator [Candidatus Lokiarchaeota archaeon]